MQKNVVFLEMSLSAARHNSECSSMVPVIQMADYYVISIVFKLVMYVRIVLNDIFLHIEDSLVRNKFGSRKQSQFRRNNLLVDGLT